MNQTMAACMQTLKNPFEGTSAAIVNGNDDDKTQLAETLRRGQNQSLEMIAKGAALTDILSQLMLLIESQSQGVYCSVLLLDDDGIHIRNGAGPSLPTEYMQALDGFEIGPTVGSCGTAMYRKEMVVVSDIMSDPLWEPYKAFVAPHGFRACWSTPIFLDKNMLLGTFAMYYREVRSPGPDDLKLIDVATHLAGIAIERNRKERELARHRDHLEELVAARTAELVVAKDRAEIINLELSKTNAELACTLNTLSLTQAELLRRDKLAALGSLVAGIAHELNTPIGNGLIVASTLAERTSDFSTTYAQGLKRSTLEKYMADASEASLILQRNLQRAADLVSSFKQIAVDHTTADRQEFSVAELITEISQTFSTPMRQQSIQLTCNIADDMQISSLPALLGQAMQSLLSNCLTHAFEGRDKGSIHITAHCKADSSAEISITDNGTGIPPHNLQRIFDPFFTSKLGAGSSGLGLYIVHNIVCGVLNGKIEVESVVGNGTTFRIVLPSCIQSEVLG
ncbi:ATP-binding protein [Undibacterium sp. Ji83W]|uniref:ATP-binding protein n=1 Tax=Undibacterium sp. Ji83W TaxID=3413043 RepID=UPI003BF3D1D1